MRLLFSAQPTSSAAQHPVWAPLILFSLLAIKVLSPAEELCEAESQFLLTLSLLGRRGGGILQAVILGSFFGVFTTRPFCLVPWFRFDDVTGPPEIFFSIAREAAGAPVAFRVHVLDVGSAPVFNYFCHF